MNAATPGTSRPHGGRTGQLDQTGTERRASEQTIGRCAVTSTRADGFRFGSRNCHVRGRPIQIAPPNGRRTERASRITCGRAKTFFVGCTVPKAPGTGVSVPRRPILLRPEGPSEFNLKGDLSAPEANRGDTPVVGKFETVGAVVVYAGQKERDSRHCETRAP